MACSVCENVDMLNQLSCQVYCQYISEFKMIVHFDEMTLLLEHYSQEKIRKVYKDIFIGLFISASLMRLKNGK